MEKKANVIFVGDLELEHFESLSNTEHLLIIECSDAAQVREILKNEKAEFTVFGE